MLGVRSRYALRFGAALFVVLLVVGVFGGVIYAHTGSELEEDVESRLITDAERDAERLDSWFRSTERTLESNTRSLEFRPTGQKSPLTTSLTVCGSYSCSSTS